MIKNIKTILAFVVSFSLFVTSSYADAIKNYATGEFSLSTLSEKDRIKELKWFQKAAKPFKGMEINVLSETIPTHEYESKTLTKAFEEITGIKVNHQLLGEGEVVQQVLFKEWEQVEPAAIHALRDRNFLRVPAAVANRAYGVA